MDRTERAQALVERAEKLGVRLVLDGDLFSANLSVNGDLQSQDGVIAEIVKHLSDVRVLVKKRSLPSRAKGFFGQRILFADVDNLNPDGPTVLSGLLSNASSDGRLIITLNREGFRNPMDQTANVEGVLIVLDEKTDGASAPQNGEPTPEKPRRGLLDRLRGSRED